MARRTFDLFSKAGVEEDTTSLTTHPKLLTDVKVKAAKMKVTMGSLMTSALIKGLPQVKTREELIHTICKEYGLDEEKMKQLAIEQDSDTIKIEESETEVKKTE